MKHYIYITIAIILLVETSFAGGFDLNTVGDAFFDPVKGAAKKYVPYMIPLCGLPGALLAQNSGAGTRFAYYLAGTAFAGLAWTAIAGSFLR